MVYAAPKSHDKNLIYNKNNAADRRIGYFLRVWLATATGAAETVLIDLSSADY